MKNIIYVLKRNNGFIGIYVDGKKDKNLVSNFYGETSTKYFFDRLKMECDRFNDYGIEFTENEEEFKSGLPTLQEYLGV